MKKNTNFGLPMKARTLLMQAAKSFPNDTEARRKERIEAAHIKVRSQFPEYFKQDGGMHDLQGSR